MPPLPRQARAPLLALLALIALVGWELGATHLQHESRPQEGHWIAAAEKLRALYQPGDPILAAPQWVDPVAREHLGGLLDVERAALSDVDRYGRIWELSIRGARHPWLSHLTPAERWTFGRVTLARFEQRAAEVLYDFRQRWQDAEVALEGDELQVCPREGARFRCDPLASWNWVGPELAEIGYQPYHCIYAHPVEGKSLRITYASAALGNRLVGYTGIGDFRARLQSAVPVRFRVTIDGEPVAEVLHRNEWPWRRFEVDTSRLGGGHHAVRFEISAEHAFARPFCFLAEARR